MTPTFAEPNVNLTEKCGPGTIPDGKVCVNICGEGTFLKDGSCAPIPPGLFGNSDIDWIGWGVVVGVLATIAGFIFAANERRKANKKEDLDLIQLYGSQISEILKDEQNLETKLDCTLYVERYLDTLEQIASLFKRGQLRQDVADYFENNFSYGINLWYWYRENAELVQRDLLDDEWNKSVKKGNENERWREFRWWCLHPGSVWKSKDEITKFIVKNRKELLEARLTQLDTQFRVDESPKKLVHIQILSRIQDALVQANERDNDIKSNEIYEIVKDENTNLDKIDKFSPLEFVTRYSKQEQYDVLPDVMQSDFEDIPDENGMTKDELVETIQRFGESLNKITNQEKELTSKLDCSLYVEQYLETLEQIATLYHKRVIPKRAADYFENKFSYGINLFNWYSKFITKQEKEFDTSDFKFEEDDEDKDDRWTEFKWFCRGAGNPKNKLTKFDEDAERKKLLEIELEILKKKKKALNNLIILPNDKENELDKILKQIEQSIPLVEFLCEHPNIPNLTLYEKIKQENENLSETQVRNFIREYSEEHRFRILPDAMFDYEWLPDEEGLKPKEVLEIMRNYSKRLSDLSSTETNLQTKIDCSIYAEQYLDILEEIAYLFNNKSLATDSLTYFENNFNYGKTIHKWYDKVVLGAGSQEERWKEFDLYCNNFTDELGLKKDIDGFGVVDSLPYAMIFYKNLAYDKNELKKLATNRKSAKEDYPPEDKPWQKKMREYYGDKPDETDET